ncbi:MAG: hypothetical protein AAB554_01585 [Patescibacteria group bacterium]
MTAMEGIGGVIRKRSESKPNTRIHSEAHALADEISAHFNERQRFAMYLGVIKRVGVPAARAIFAEIKSESNARNPRKLFMWLAKNPKK